MFGVFKPTAETVFGPENVDSYEVANMAGKDFAPHNRIVRAFVYWLGIASEEKGVNPTLHAPEFHIDERVLRVGMALQIVQILKLAEYRAGGGTFDYD